VLTFLEVLIELIPSAAWSAAAVVVVIVLLVRSVRATLRRRELLRTSSQPRCRRCGYLACRGATPRCPECGVDWHRAGLLTARTYTPIYPVGWLLLLGAVLALPCWFAATPLARVQPWSWNYEVSRELKVEGIEGPILTAATGRGRWMKFGTPQPHLHWIHFTAHYQDRMVQLDRMSNGQTIFLDLRNDRIVPAVDRALMHEFVLSIKVLPDVAQAEAADRLLADWVAYERGELPGQFDARSSAVQAEYRLREESEWQTFAVLFTLAWIFAWWRLHRGHRRRVKLGTIRGRRLARSWCSAEVESGGAITRA
jgi:hypothetical protein